jgi:hypothetical protein
MIELMVAIGVFGLIMVGVIATWKCIIRGVEVAELSAAACQRARIGMKTIETALSVVEISRANISYYSFLTDTSGKYAAMSFAGRMPASFPGSGYYGDEVMRRVTFDVEEGADHVNNLMLTQTPLLAAGFEKTSPYQMVLARDVSAFFLEFWSVKDADWEQEWDDTNNIPPLIRVTLGVGHVEGDQKTSFALICREVAPPAVPH